MHLASKEVRWEVRRGAEEKVQEEFRLQTAIATLQALRRGAREQFHRLFAKLPGLSREEEK